MQELTEVLFLEVGEACLSERYSVLLIGKQTTIAEGSLLHRSFHG